MMVPDPCQEMAQAGISPTLVMQHGLNFKDIYQAENTHHLFMSRVYTDFCVFFFRGIKSLTHFFFLVGGEFFFEKYVCCDLMSQIRMVGDGAHHKLGTTVFHGFYRINPSFFFLQKIRFLLVLIGLLKALHSPP